MPRLVPAITLLTLPFPGALPSPQNSPAPEGSPACVADFERVEALVRDDYAGFQDKLRGREAELAGFTGRPRAAGAAPPPAK